MRPIHLQLATADEITQLLSRLSEGDREAEDKIVGMVYKDLRRLAKWYLAAERADHTLSGNGTCSRGVLAHYSEKRSCEDLA